MLPSIPARAEFREIVEAAAARDGKLAEERYASLMSRMGMLILASAAPQHDASRLRGYVLALTPQDQK